MNSQRLLVLILRAIAVSAVFALIPVFMPHAWMDAIHRHLGLGPLPETPTTIYLTRSLSAMYAMHAGLLWIISRDLRHFAALVTYVGVVLLAFGATLIWIDCRAGLPWLWVASEGPFTISLGVAVLVLQRRLRS